VARTTLFSNFLFTNLFSIKFLYVFIISSLFSYFNLWSENWRTELLYGQNKNRGEKMGLLGMNTCPSLNDIMDIRCNKCTRSEQGYDF
jgi:hypothetical protein